MKIDYKKAVQHQQFDDILRQSGVIQLPDFMRAVYSALKTSQEARKVNIESGFAYGGMFSDEALGIQPNDYDIYICSPEWVDFVKRYHRACDDAYGFKETRELAEERDGWVTGYNFPLTLMSDNFKILNSGPFGDYIEFNGTYTDDKGVMRIIDVKVGTEPISAKEFLTYVPAPIMAAAVSLSSDETVCHRDFETHIKHKILATTNVLSTSLKEKALRKGLTIMTPSAAAEVVLEPLDLGGERHEDRLSVSAGSKPKLGPTVV